MPKDNINDLPRLYYTYDLGQTQRSFVMSYQILLMNFFDSNGANPESLIHFVNGLGECLPTVGPPVITVHIHIKRSCRSPYGAVPRFHKFGVD